MTRRPCRHDLRDIARSVLEAWHARIASGEPTRIEPSRCKQVALPNPPPVHDARQTSLKF